MKKLDDDFGSAIIMNKDENEALKVRLENAKAAIDDMLSLFGTAKTRKKSGRPRKPRTPKTSPEGTRNPAGSPPTSNE